LFSTNTASVEPSQSSFPYNLNTSRMCRLCRWLFAAGNFAASESDRGRFVGPTVMLQLGRFE
jgi:hypothetical protein